MAHRFGYTVAIATERAIQLDELINWVKRQVRIDPNARSPAR